MAGALPTWPELERWLMSAREVEAGLRKGDPQFSLQMKKAHVYARVLKSEEVIGRVKPETASTSVRAEITTFNIGRALGCGELFQPAVHLELHGKGLASFRRLVEATTFQGDKEEERQELLRAMDNEPHVLRTAYKPLTPERALKYRGAELPEEPPNGGLDTNDVIARFLRHDAPQPGHAPVALEEAGGVQASPARLARELSNILLVDALAGQWDRFSGNNLHLLPTTDAAQLLAIDNGGADPTNDQGYLQKFERWVTRFDPVVTGHLEALEVFFRKRGGFRGFGSEEALSRALDFRDRQEWKAFRERVHRVAGHVRSVKAGGAFERAS